jgi:REP element-mobilizing transposase RayT
MPLLDGSFQQAIYACIHAECNMLNVEVLALGGVEDHVHLLARLPTSVAVPDVAKQMKGSSSHLATHGLGHTGFKWQEGYSAFSVSRWDVPKIADYIRGQEEHHRLHLTKPVLEPTG